MMKRLSTLVPLVAVLGLSAFAGTAAAGPCPTPPEGLTGAKHMTNSHAFPGMMHAMTVNNENGNIGMRHAVHLTSADPDNCP